MASIDQRIVELKFDGKNFQSGIQAAIAALDNLKKNLNMDKAANEFDKVEKASKKVSFNELASSVDTISQRFSTLGIIGMSALNQLTTSAIQAGKNVLSALLNPLIEGGKQRALNIEQAKFQIEGLGYTWAQVEEDINYGVKDTAYGLDAAAKACSMLLASQVQVGDEMKTSLRAISGVAAMTGSEYENIANIFTTVAGNGRLMGDQLLQLSTRGLNAAAILGKYLGKTETEIRDMVSKGQIDFKTFAAAMDDAFGEHAKRANETFTGSLSNMKAALARIGAEFATPAYQNLRDIFNSLIPVIDGVKLALTPLIETAKVGMKYLTDFATKTLSSFGDKEGVAAKLAPVMTSLNALVQNFGSLLLNIARLVGSIVGPIFSAFSEVLGITLIDAISGAIKVISDFIDSLVFTERMSDNLKKTFTGIFTVVDILFKAITSIIALVASTLFSVFSAVFGFILDVILAITGHIGTFIVRVKDLIKTFLELKTVKDLLSAIATVFNKLKEIASKVYSAFRKLVGIVIDSAFESALWIFDKMADALMLLVKFIDASITKIREFIGWLKSLPAVQNFITNIKNTFEELKTNIGGVASELGSKFITAFNTAKDVIGDFISRLKDLVSQYIEIPSLQDVIATVVEFMTKTFEGAVKIFNEVKEVLTDIFSRAADLSKVSFKAILENFEKLRRKIVEVIDVSGKLTFLSNLFNDIKNGAARAAQDTGTVLGQIKEKLIQFVEWVKTKFSQLTIGDVMAAAIGGTFVVFLVQLTKFIKTVDSLTGALTKGVDVFNKITKSITKAIDSFGELNKAKAQSIKMEAISDLIKAVVLLAGAVALLASMDTNKVLVSAGVIFVLAGALIGLTTAMNVINSKVDPKAITATALELGVAVGSVLALAVSLRLLATLNVGELIAGLVAVTLLMGEVFAFMLVMNKLGKKAPELIRNSTSMLLIAGSVLLLAKAVAMMGQVSPQDLFMSMTVMTVLLAALGLMIRVAGQAGMSKGAAVSLVAAVGSIYMVIFAMKMLAAMDAQTIASGLTRLLELFAVLGLLFVGVRVAGKHAAGAGAAILLISVAMNVMVLAIKQMASIDDGMLQQATKSINEMLKIFALITLMSAFTGKHAWQAGAAIGMMSASILVLAAAMVVLSRLDNGDLQRATKVIVELLAMFAIITAATGLVKQCEKTILQITICLGLLVASLAVLSLVEPSNLLAASMAISLLMATLSLVLAAAGIGKKSMAAVWQLVAVVGVLAILLAALTELDAANALVAATALSELLVVIGGLLLAMSLLKVGPSVAAAAQFAAAIDVFILIVGALVAVAGAINQAFPEFSKLLDDGIPILQKIGQALGEFVGGVIGGIAAGASYGLITLAENLSTFIEALKPFMAEVSNIDDSVVDGAMKLVQMMLLFAAADLINSLTFWYDGKSAIESMSEGLPLLGNAMKDFSDSLNGVSLESLAIGSEAARILAEVGLLMSEGGLKGLILGSAAEGMEGLAENLPNLGRAIKAYGDSVDGLNADAINNSVGPLRSMVEINNMIAGEGDSFLNWFMGSHAEGIAKLSENLPTLGDAITAYGDSVANLNASAIDASVGPLRSMVEINNMIETEGGDFLNWFMGSHAEGISKLSENLPTLGDALTAYGDSVSDLKADAVRNSVDPLRSLVEINNMIENEGGNFLNWFIGSKAEGISKLSENLPTLGAALTEYSNSLDGMDAERIASSVDPLRNLVEISNMIDNEGGAQSWIFGSSSDGINQFKDNLPLLGQALKEYSDSVTDVKPDAVNISVDCLRTIITVLNEVNGGISAIFGGGTGGGITSLKEHLPGLGEALLAYSNYVVDVSAEAVDRSVECIRKIIEVIGTGAEYSESMRTFGFDLKTFGESFSSFITQLDGLPYEAIDKAVDSLNKLKQAMDNWVNNFPDITPQLNNFVNSLKTASQAGVDAFINTFRNATAQAGATALAMVNFALMQMTNRLNRANSEFLSMGRTLMTNLANGMRSTIPTVTATLDSLLSQMSTRLTRATQEFYNHGKNLAIYLANGLKSASSNVTNALNSALSGLSSQVRSYYNEMYNAGYYLMSGLEAGIRGNSSGPVNAAYSVGAAVVAALKAATDEASPSKEAIKVGKFVDLGLMKGIVRYSGQAINAAGELGDDMIAELYSAQNKFAFLEDIDPIITPQLDTTDIDRGINKLSKRLEMMKSIPITDQRMLAQMAYKEMMISDLMKVQEIQNGTPSQIVNNYDLTQNNYSPKALSRIDIYRDTKNQFTRLKEVVNA